MRIVLLTLSLSNKDCLLSLSSFRDANEAAYSMACSLAVTLRIETTSHSPR